MILPRFIHEFHCHKNVIFGLVIIHDLDMVLFTGLSLLSLAQVQKWCVALEAAPAFEPNLVEAQRVERNLC